MRIQNIYIPNLFARNSKFSEGKMTIAFLLLKLSFTVRKANYASSKGKFDLKIEKIFRKICYFEEFQNAKKRCSIILRYPLELL